MSIPTRASGLLARAAPVVFVVLWASGFIVARTVRTHADPESFVALRFLLSALILAGIAFIGRASWPRTGRAWGASFVAGILMQGLYVGGVFWGVKNGLSAAVAALISGLQPLMTGVLAGPLLGERVSRLRWLGILVGFLGALLVLAPNVAGAAAVSPLAVLACFGATVSLTLGTIWQKRIGANVDLRSGAAIQFLGGVAVTLPHWRWPPSTGISTTRFRCISRSSGVSWVFRWRRRCCCSALIRHGAVARVTSLFYLVPPITALMALVLFGEGLVPIQIVGHGGRRARRRHRQSRLTPRDFLWPWRGRSNRKAMRAPLHP